MTVATRIRELVAAGELKKALDLLMAEGATLSPQLASDAVVLLSRHAQLKRATTLGTLSEEAASAQRARLAHNLLSLVEPYASSAPAPAPAATPGPVRVFISYAHEEADSRSSAFLKKLLVHLEPLRREGAVEVWWDERIEPGNRWHGEITEALERAQVAILLVGAELLASDYVFRHELPALFLRWHSRQLRLLCVLLEDCAFQGARYRYPDPDGGPHEVRLGELQFAHPPDRPLSSLADAEQDSILTQLATTLRKLASA